MLNHVTQGDTLSGPVTLSDRAPSHATPFLKWAGGKSQLLPALSQLLPERIGNYFEPFIGGGAVFFFLQGAGRISGNVTLADVNAELINAYLAVQNNVDDLVELLMRHRAAHCKEHYYAVRAQDHTSDVAGAARTIYLNKTGFNGLYRVNKSGLFNVPMGRYKNPSIFNEATLRSASRALAGVRLLVQPYFETISMAGKGDFLYLDPPYVPLSGTAYFTAYSPGGFGPADQVRLADCVTQASGRAANFALSNAYVPSVLELYREFRIERVPATRRINCDASKRGVVEEAVVMNYRLDRER